MAQVLLVEDECNLRMLYRMELQAEGHEIVEAATGAEAVQLLKSSRPLHAVILDLNLPDVRGWQLLDVIAARRPALPAIINTAYGHLLQEFREWRADAYVVKSSDLTDLKKALARCLAASSRREQENMIEFKRSRFE